MKEDDAMVYRRPYLTSGSSGFALNAISRTMKKELKVGALSLYFFLSSSRISFPCKENKQMQAFGNQSRYIFYLQQLCF